MEIEPINVDETPNQLDSCLSRIRWRLRSTSKRRLQTDILALCTKLRPVVMIDYGGKMPELQANLCALLSLMKKESTNFLPLRVMVIEDMIYIVHMIELSEYTLATLSLQIQIQFIDLERDPPRMVLQSDENPVVSELLAIQKIFSDEFPTDINQGQIPEIIDLSEAVKESQITLPTINGWLLGYPVVYLFSKDNAADATCNLSTKSLHIYQIIISRNLKSGIKTSEELTSFTVPCDLSLGEDKEPWAEVFFARLMEKFEACRHVWTDMKMEVNQCYPQSIVL